MRGTASTVTSELSIGEDIHVVGSAETVITAEDHKGDARNVLAFFNQRRRERASGLKNVAHDRADLVLEGEELTQGLLVLMYFGRRDHLHGAGDLFT